MKIERIITDNGACYRSSALVAALGGAEHQREQALKTWNLHYNYHRPHGARVVDPPASTTPQRVNNVLASYN
ncbi:hypothetical protein GCM10022263_30650 [Nocardioides daeguensis]|uniref:Integrase catalytic domain-containing protein n=1 Tax=Nocardioides daeguensis TaxID=908359 RepID=A0ABP6VX27_9ACTN